MNHKLMISYSRRQTPFVGHLAGELEDEGYSLWLDYQNLVPAQPWHQQIERGISKSDILLLVVSKDSILSKNVESEWRLALEYKKRIILVIFEAVPLPPELQHFDWVDFRVNHKKSLKKLSQLAENPPGEVKSTPPQSGFKAHPSFWLALILSCVVLIVSIPSWWTFFIPYLLVPLPSQIYKRNYNFTRVTTALLFLPVLALLTFMLIVFSNANTSLYLVTSGKRPTGTLFDPNIGTYIGVYGSIVLSTSWILLALLLTPAMQRRALPEAARVKFASPLILNVDQPRPVAFAIDYAPEDGRVAEDIRRGLEAHGHHMAVPTEKAEAIFALISTYKTSTEYDPDQQAVYPILLQAVGEMESKLERIQWIDFRKGISNIDKLAMLLPDPQRLLKALAIPPTGSLEVFPLIVNMLQYFYLLTAMIGGGTILVAIYGWKDAIYRFELDIEKFWGVAGGNIILAFITFVFFLPVLVIFSLRGLRSRRGGTAAVYPILVLTFLQVILYITTFLSAAFKINELPGGLLEGIERAGIGAAMASSASLAFMSAAVIYVVILLITITFLIFRWRELYRWLPRRQSENPVGIFESILLLYTPLRKKALLFHVVFHTVLALLLISIILDGGRPLLNCLLFFAIGTRGLTIFVSK